ncbi:RING-type domain-containing protein [Fusarium keratoplasticum]|uniref:RING-type domain-containing protein n=1 Tax=Fusarium keratoplasticum TaxID=1328300 RepID=A0ACC0QZW8_9HYPO|nr:RING-type domain-containing protein [Fusarium keratoplasticum]KAI8671014.1 RING-type domain-containing protein [Fusarium keratoplasticum]
MLRSFKNRASSVFRKKKAADTEPAPDLPVPPSPADTSAPGPARYIPPPPPPPPYSQPSTSLYTPSTASTRPEQNQQEREQEQERDQEQQPRDDHQQDQLLDQAPAHQPPAPDPAAPDPFAPKYVPYIEATPLKNNMFAGTAGRYGRVNPDIMGGFGDDDDSIWLVDDEESDEEQRREQRNNQVRTSNSLRTPSRPVSRHSTASSSRTPATTQILDSGPAPPSSSLRPAFRYHVPSLLDDDEFTSGTLSSTVATPETPPTQETSPAPRRGYGPVAPSILNLTDLGVDADDIHEPPSKRRNVTPLPTRPAVASSSSSSLVNPYVARFQQPDDAKIPASLRQLDQSADDVADDFSFGQRYQKAPDSSDVIVTHQRIPAEASTGDVECLVCTETKGANAFPRFSITSSCTHPPSTCLDCIQLSIESDLSSKLWTEIRCPECRELLEYVDIQRYANNQTFTRYETLALRAAMSEAENFIWCTSGCGSGQIHDSGSEQPIVTCLHCGHRSCFHHNVVWHQTLSCDEYDQLLADPENFRSNLEIENEKWSEAQRAQLEADRAMAQGLLAEDQAERRRQEERERKEREQAQKAAKLARQIAARRKREEEQSRATVSQTTKPCPGCGWAIEKNRGCSHMTCKLIPVVLDFLLVAPLRLNPALDGIKCKHEFCFECGANHREIMKNDNSVHKRTCRYHPDNLEDYEGEDTE